MLKNIEESLYLTACSVNGCASDTMALLTSDTGRTDRLCVMHYGEVIARLDMEREVRDTLAEARRGSDIFAALSPIEQWQLEGR